MALARGEGAEVIDLGIVPDRVDATVAAIRRARDAGADILVTTGGASVGDYDLVQQALAAEGLDAVVLEGGAAARPADDARPARRDARARPARQSGLGLCLRVPVPGAADPPARRAQRSSQPRTESAVLGCDLPANDERADYLRATLARGADGTLVATPFPMQDSSMMAALAKADCLVIREPYAPRGQGRQPLRDP